MLTAHRCETVPVVDNPRHLRLQSTIDRVSVLFRTDVAGHCPVDHLGWEIANDSLQHVGHFADMGYQEHGMDVNKDQIKGRTKEVEGKINEVVGKVVGDKKLEVKGKVQQIGGEAQAKLGDVRQDLKDSFEKGA
jgi:uncharacterized protein YjbJ (UPF0337 family)